MADAGQTVAGSERIVPDVGDAGGNGVTSAPAARILDERGLALVEQHPSHTAIGGIVWSHCYCRKAGAITEGIPPDAGDAVGNRDAGHEFIIECPIRMLVTG